MVVFLESSAQHGDVGSWVGMSGIIHRFRTYEWSRSAVKTWNLHPSDVFVLEETRVQRTRVTRVDERIVKSMPMHDFIEATAVESC